LVAAGGIPKPAFNAFLLLARLGTERLRSESENALITRQPDKTIVAALWNYAEPDQHAPPRTFDLDLGSPHRATVYRLDDNHASSTAAWHSMGRPSNPTRAQIRSLRDAANIRPPEQIASAPVIRVSVPAHGLAIVEIAR
jgi:xylan 1,4-beta-xylosidase